MILVWADMEHLIPLGVQTPDHPANNGTLHEHYLGSHSDSVSQ